MGATVLYTNQIIKNGFYKYYCCKYIIIIIINLKETLYLH